MSTRCQIDFIGKWKDREGKMHTDRRRVYRHSDGYPEGVIPDLKEFLKWLTGGEMARSFGDLEYTVANFIYWSKKGHEKYGGGWEKLGFGVCDVNEFHGDIEYFYEVIGEVGDDKIVIKVYKVQRISWDKPVTMKNMKLIKTVHLKKTKRGYTTVRKHPRKTKRKVTNVRKHKRKLPKRKVKR